MALAVGHLLELGQRRSQALGNLRCDDIGFSEIGVVGDGLYEYTAMGKRWTLAGMPTTDPRLMSKVTSSRDQKRFSSSSCGRDDGRRADRMALNGPVRCG